MPKCYFYEWGTARDIFWNVPCSSPYALDGDLPDGCYKFRVYVQDEAGNRGSGTTFFYVDTVAPQILTTKLTGRRVSPTADVVVTFDDDVYESKQFVNIYKKGSSTPLAVNRYAYGDEEIELDPKNSLRRGTQYTVKVSPLGSTTGPTTWRLRRPGRTRRGKGARRWLRNFQGWRSGGVW